MLMQRKAAASPPTSAQQAFESPSHANGNGAIFAPAPQNPASHAQLNSRGSLSPSPVASGRELATAPQACELISPRTAS